MRKFTFALIMMLGFASMGIAQHRSIETAESIKMNLFDCGTGGSVSVVANPDATGANTSLYVAKMVIGITGRQPWAGWYATIPTAIDMTANKYIHVKVWKPRISPTCFKVEKSGGDSGDTFPITESAETGKWVEVVFDYTSKADVSGEYVKIVLVPDFEKPYTGTSDVTLYFDDIYVNNDPAVGSTPVVTIENFETTEMNIMLNGADDLSAFSKIPNPDKSGINLSDNVIKLHRDKDGAPHDGFWGHVLPKLDITGNKYVHVKVWKPRISELKFKLEGGPGVPATSERVSAAPQLKTNAWEDIVWDFTDMADGEYPIIAFLPDFESPVTLTEDIDLYFDDIRVNNNPQPLKNLSQIFQVDMNGAGLVEGDKVYMVGAVGGKYGIWETPGSNPACEMSDPDGDGIYTIDMQLPDGVIAFKFFKTTAAKPATWDYGDPFTGGDRTYNVYENSNVIYTWGSGGFEVGVKEKPLAGKVNIYPNPVRNELTVNSTSDLRSATITSMVGKVVAKYAFNNSGVNTINTSNLSSGMYFVTFVGKDGNKVTQKLIKD